MVGLEPIDKIMNVYYEFHDDHIGREVSNFGYTIPSKYCVRHNIYDVAGPFVPGRLVHAARRMWQEDKQGVVYLKHRDEVDPEVDPKEFMFIKLKAVTLDV